MIVRDEEALLPRCLASVVDRVDEIVVVDTGSTDGTVRVASAHGARVSHVTWTGDFSTARNRSLDEATGEWILVLDADEVLESWDAEALDEQLADPGLLALEITLINEYGRGETRRFRAARLFRNRPEIRFELPVHERVTPSVARLIERGHGRTAVASITVRHTGYTPERIAGRDKSRRNRGILQACLDDGVDDPYVEYQLARHDLRLVGEKLLARRELPACVERLQRVCRRLAPPLPAWAPEVWLRLAQAGRALGRDDEAAARLAEGIAAVGDRLDFRCLRGLLRSDAATLESCVGAPVPTDGFETDEQYAGAYPLAALGRLALARGDDAAARRWLEQARRQAPWYATPHVVAGDHALQRGAAARALHRFMTAVQTCPDDPDGWTGAARAARELGQPDQARQWIARVLEQLPLHGPARELSRRLGLTPPSRVATMGPR